MHIQKEKIIIINAIFTTLVIFSRISGSNYYFHLSAFAEQDGAQLDLCKSLF